MTEAVKLVTFISIIFVILLMLSGSFDGIIGEILYYFAFLVPFAIGFYASKGLKYKREEEKGVAESDDTLLKFDKKRTLKLLPIIPVTVLVIFLVSLLSSLLLSLIGVSAPAVEDIGILEMLIIHALIPSVLEELLFRYIPMKLLLPYSPRWCVIYSALSFALIHCSFIQMPYAFVAGVIFMLTDIAFGSVWPSLILHLVNNAVSIVWMKYCYGVVPSLIFIAVLLVSALVSMYFIIRRKDEYKADLLLGFDKGESFKVTYAPIALMVICCYVAAASL